jgi:hypothetical protein
MAFELPGSGRLLYQQIVELLEEQTPNADGNRVINASELGDVINGGDSVLLKAVAANANRALVAHPNHPLHGWTITYDAREWQFIARPPLAQPDKTATNPS